MSKPYQKYEQYEVKDFVLDGDFINWVKEADTAADFWEQLIAVHPHQAQNIDRARKLVLSLKVAGDQAPEEIKNRIWKEVQVQASPGRVVKMYRRKIWMAAASIAVILLAAAWILSIGTKNKNEMAKTESGRPGNDVLPGGNRAILTLANGATIILDSAQNGALARQGNTKILKLDDGTVSYHSNTEAPASVQFNTITTPRGGQYQLILADGSRVWINAGSSITFPTSFNGSERRVTITGEAYFEVAHNAEKPFHVLINDPVKGNMDVQVLGTHFNVNAYSDEDAIKTTLLEGSVKVSSQSRSVVIVPGQQAVAAGSADGISVRKDIDMDQVVAWKNGYFQFDNNTIQEIMRQLSRWYNVEVVYKGKIPAGHYVGKPSRNLNLSQILKVIEYSGVKMEIQGNKIIINE